jgi:hypothetical protein
VKLYRVHPYDNSAAQDQPGGALFVPVGGHNRFDNPKLYHAFYASTDPAGAIIERLGDLDAWNADALLAPKPARVPLPLALSEYEANVHLLDLANVSTLTHLAVARATTVVTRDRTATQALAAEAFQLHATDHHGLAWWSYYDPEIVNVILWTLADVNYLSSTPLAVTTPTLIATAARFHRKIERAYDARSIFARTDQ